jgi:hypothetical protein
MIPNQLKTKLLETMHACMDLPAIQQFTIINKDVFAISYDDAVGQIGPIQGFPKYVDKLEQFDTVFYFIRLLCDEYSKNIRATELKEQFYRIYEDTSNGGMRIRGEFLDSIMLENNTLPFIGRHNIKVSLQQMLNSQQSRISLIKGSPRMGRSYLQHYLSEIAGKTRRYELVPIDLAAVHSEFAEAEESLWGSHVAAYIGGYLGLPVAVDPAAKGLFKHTPFIGQLRNYIRERQRTCLFFFDQFEAITPALDLSSFILGIADLALDQSGVESYSFLAGSSDREITNIPFRLRAVLAQPSSTLVVDNFDQAQVETFFKKVYLYMSTVYKIDDDMDTFMTNVNSDLLPPSIYAPPNVERIGRTVMQWLQNQS